MQVHWEFIPLLISVTTGVLSISSHLWKINKFLGSKSKSVDTRIHSLYDALKVQSARLSDIADYLSVPNESRSDFHKRKSL